MHAEALLCREAAKQKIRKGWDHQPGSIASTSPVRQKNKITWPQNPRFFHVRKFCHISKQEAGISSFCCFAAMSAVDRGQEISLSNRYFLLLQAMIKGSKVLRAQVVERTENEEGVNRLTFKL